MFGPSPSENTRAQTTGSGVEVKGKAGQLRSGPEEAAQVGAGTAGAKAAQCEDW